MENSNRYVQVISMEKGDFQKIVKNYFKEKGFRFKGNNGYKLIDDDYLIGVSLDHNPYCEGYFIEYGVVFLPDDKKFPFKGFFDWDDRFLFTKSSNIDWEKYQIIENQYDEDLLSECFEYCGRTENDLLEQLNVNNKLKINALLDKEFVLKDYAKQLDVFSRLPEYTIEKLLKIYKFDRSEISRLRKQWGYDKCDF